MNIEKSNWSSNGENLHLSVPFTKVNKEKRTVSGFATLDNVDQTGDVVTAEASMAAFANFRGNIREMHSPLAVGKMVSFKPETYYDEKTQKFYNGVYVTTYVSKGAQDTWEKCLDGTLTGFSIGGKIKDSENVANKASGETVRFIKEYDLVELSIVDSPANELCNIFSIEKVNGAMMFKGMAADVVTENIFHCSDSNSVFLSTEKTFDSPISGKPMEIIGWVEKSDVNKSVEVQKILDSFKNSRLSLPDSQTIAKQVDTEGDIMSENMETTTVEETVVETPAVEETVVVEEAPAEIAAAEETPAETLEKAADVSEVMVDEPDFAKMLGDLKGFFSETLNKAAEVNAAQVTSIQATVEEFSKSVDGRITEMADQYTALTKAVEDIRNTIDGVEKRVDAVEGETAIKKSSDLGGSQEVTIKKSNKWNGALLGSVAELMK